MFSEALTKIYKTNLVKKRRMFVCRFLQVQACNKPSKSFHLAQMVFWRSGFSFQGGLKAGIRILSKSSCLLFVQNSYSHEQTPSTETYLAFPWKHLRMPPWKGWRDSLNSLVLHQCFAKLKTAFYCKKHKRKCWCCFRQRWGCKVRCVAEM